MNRIQSVRSFVKRALNRTRGAVRNKADAGRDLRVATPSAPAIKRVAPMNAIIHIGEPKSGSTTIQSFLFQNRDALARQGFRHHRFAAHVTSQFELPLETFRRLGQLPSDESKRRKYQAMTQEQLAENVRPKIDLLRAYPSRFAEKTAVFSSEHIVPWIETTDLVREFDAMMAETFEERRYILYLREPVSRLVSNYSERMKRGQSASFDHYLDQADQRTPQSAIASVWAATLGRDSVDIRLLDPGFLINGDLIDDFAATCGMEMAGLQRPRRANESLTALGVVVLRALNRRIPMLTEDGKRNPLRKGLLAAVMRKTANSAPFEPSPEQLLRLEEIVKPSNDSLQRDFFPERVELFQKRKRREQLNVEALNLAAIDVLTEIITDLRLGNIASLDDSETANALSREPGDYIEE